MIKLFPKKSLGQNFLINQGVVARIIEAAELNSNETVLEVGPGSGVLTKVLAERAGRLFAVEKDHRAIEILKKELPSTVQIIEEDVLKFDPRAAGLTAGEYKVVANLPYYITSHFLRLMLEEWPRPALAVLMVQREVAQRMLAKPPDMNMLALSVQYYAKVSVVMQVSRGSFRPIPNVDSAVIKLVPKETPFSPEKTQKLFDIAGECFSGKRKQLITTLPGAIGKDKEETRILLEKLNINPMARPETLRLDDWLNLLKELQ
ncbi:MAG: ribosomal RNA small subunit methyltransferase A [Candidatus Yanofskybacteria bacterium RIFCSPLOWO2_02_FULL_47_9b]|uniref:Ribosomal RNA small subunit methyltransferase A n=1 Tax=Candidatus Yanofskybacteria bacterium RIFCSPLOWO2_02_FULL_47_9b TaxID=1802708 RepID=A0A1F8H7C2_9BACT|nr:MAG: ribosomal RNA small subunit methyltransferase A [Candidatus Yanofskybacteria bacterium RIFCSPLOWO2_02_FULL_47_9b]